MSRSKNNLQIAMYIYLALIFVITFVVADKLSSKQALAIFCVLLIPFLIGHTFIYGVKSQIKGMEMVLKSPPKPGSAIDLSLYLGEHLLIPGPEPFVVEYPKDGVQAEKTLNKDADAFGPLEVESFNKVRLRGTKPTKKDFEDIYIQARNREITDLHQAYDLWKGKYPERANALVDPWSSFKHGMETQEKLNGKIFDRGN